MEKHKTYFNKQLGYYMIYDPSREYCIPLHKYLAEKRLRRKLKWNEIVHHRDDNKRNNRLSNLRVVSRKRHNHIQHSNEQDWHGHNNPSYNMSRSHRIALRKAWIARKRQFGATGAMRPGRLRALGRKNGMKKGK